MLKSSYLFLIVVLFSFGCSQSSIPSSSNAERYSEDLSIYRPKYEVDREEESTDSKESQEPETEEFEAKYDVTKKLDTILDSIDVLNNDIRYIDGFTIQVYYGTNSSEASLVKGKVKRLLPESSPALKYDEPNFRVKVGKFYSRLEAQDTYARIKSRFSDALVIPERIYIK